MNIATFVKTQTLITEASPVFALWHWHNAKAGLASMIRVRVLFKKKKNCS